MGKRFIYLVTVFLIFLASEAFAISALNNHVRIIEDSFWLITFGLMCYAGLTMGFISSNILRKVYYYFSMVAFSGVIWKGLGLIKRGFEIKEPVWLFDIVREVFEGLTGVLLAVVFILLIIAIKKISNTHSK